MSGPITYVGIDAHKVELHVALLAPDASAPVTWKVQNEARAVERLRRKLEKAAPGPVACCYEAGPCGYALQRQLERGQVQCQVIAPALVPRKPGERIKTAEGVESLAPLDAQRGCRRVPRVVDAGVDDAAVVRARSSPGRGRRSIVGCPRQGSPRVTAATAARRSVDLPTFSCAWSSVTRPW